MLQDTSISIFQDTRRIKRSGKYPVKIRVYSGVTRKAKLYPTQFELSKDEFWCILHSKRTPKKYRDMQIQLRAIESKANSVVKELIPFTFEGFEKRFYRRKGDGVNLAYWYNLIIEDLNKHGRIESANLYRQSMNALRCKDGDIEKLSLLDINADWLTDYEYQMTEVLGKSPTTVGMYLRPLKAIFNRAIEDGDIDKAYYPFGKHRYQIPSGRSVKKALTNDQLRILFDAVPETPEQEKARDFWFFSFFCSGMNVKDICQLRYRDIKDGKIEYLRAKTKITSKTHSKPIVIYLNDFTKGIIKKYGNRNRPDNFVFGILNDNLNPEQKQGRVKRFTRFINQHIKKIAVASNLPPDISTYWARHSFATTALRKGKTPVFVQESLGHKDIKTTLGYFAGFPDETKREFAQALMDF